MDKEGEPQVPESVRKDVENLRAELEVERAARQAAETKTGSLEAEVTTLRTQVGRLEKGFEAVTGLLGVMRESYEATASRFRIPEKERPTTKEGWTNLIREQVTRFRELGESPYTPYLWQEKPRVERILDSVPPGEEELLEALTNELWVMQREDKLYYQWKQRCTDLRTLGELLGVAPAGGVVLTPDVLKALSDLPEAKPPKWLEEIIPLDKRSLSVQISRSLYFYTRFFGGWSERMAKELDKKGGIEQKGREKWRRGEFGKDSARWESWVTGELEKVDWMKDGEMDELNKRVLEKLGLGKEGKVPYRILKLIVKEMPEDLRGNEWCQWLRERAEKAPDVGGLSLLELLQIGDIIKDPEKPKVIKRGVVNMFAQNVDQAQVDYARWLVSSLCGSEYAEESALRFLVYTGEAGRMNTTDAPVPFMADVFNRLCHPERRRLSERRKNRAAGPMVTLGRYPPGLCRSWLESAEFTVSRGRKEKVIDLLRKGIWFHELPWGQLSEEHYVGKFFLPLMRAVGVFNSISDRNLELMGREGLFEGDNLERLNKNFQSAFPGWKDYKKREGQARKVAEKLKGVKGLARKKQLDEFGKQKWSPWFTFIFGLIYERQPDQKLPQNEIQSPTGIKMEEKILHSRRWHKNPQKAEAGNLWNPDSVADLLNKCLESGFLTSWERKLLKEICQV